MRRALASLIFLLGSLAMAAGPELRLSPRKIRDEVHVIVETQLAALRQGDFAAAYEMASAGVKAQFDLPIFAAMIRRGYPLLLQSSKADLGVVRDRNGEVAEVTVTVSSRQKRDVVYRYLLVHESEGWRITGVVLEQRPAHADA